MAISLSAFAAGRDTRPNLIFGCVVFRVWWFFRPNLIFGDNFCASVRRGRGYLIETVTRGQGRISAGRPGRDRRRAGRLADAATRLCPCHSLIDTMESQQLQALLEHVGRNLRAIARFGRLARLGRLVVDRLQVVHASFERSLRFAEQRPDLVGR